MSDYIKREAISEIIAAQCGECADICWEFDGFMPDCNSWCALGIAAKSINELPAADVRPVVVCGKCKYGKHTGTEWFCDKHSGHADKFGEDASYHEYHSKYWFCADGEERKHE